MGKVASKTGLVERRINISNQSCDRCGLDLEDANHIFVTCLFARSIWWNVFAWVRIPFPMDATKLDDIFVRDHRFQPGLVHLEEDCSPRRVSYHLADLDGPK
ncbi:putative reverse transcriptase zinc-binding domain-containing protein [Helianthus annuus]|nr:putative reverse transcriptase zinc-binding domain-containing protein [Helianthus annuus]